MLGEGAGLVKILVISSQLVGEKNEIPVRVQISGSVWIKGKKMGFFFFFYTEMYLGLKITSSPIAKLAASSF